tara:strand:- start:15368 stop:15736 length:369 start_codon:yes stop_codon:yes gene_type:complete
MAKPVEYTEEQIQKASYPDLPNELITSKTPIKRLDTPHGRVYYGIDQEEGKRTYIYSSTTILDNTLTKGIGFNMWLGNANSYKDAMEYGKERAEVGSITHALCMYLIWGYEIDTDNGFLIED